MKKIALKVHPLQERIEAFQKTPVWEVRPSNEESKLRKIGRNRLLKEVSLPLIANQRPEGQQGDKGGRGGQGGTRELWGELRGKENRAAEKNLSLVRAKPLVMEQQLDRMAVTQKMVSEGEKLKETGAKKQFLIREKKLVPLRNCLSANLRR